MGSPSLELVKLQAVRPQAEGSECRVYCMTSGEFFWPAMFCELVTAGESSCTPLPLSHWHHFFRRTRQGLFLYWSGGLFPFSKISVSDTAHLLRLDSVAICGPEAALWNYSYLYHRPCSLLPQDPSVWFLLQLNTTLKSVYPKNVEITVISNYFWFLMSEGNKIKVWRIINWSVSTGHSLKVAWSSVLHHTCWRCKLIPIFTIIKLKNKFSKVTW